MIITISDDFDLQKIAYSGQCFRCALINGMYRFITDNAVIYLKQLSETKYDASCTPGEWEQIWSPYFDIARDYRQIRKSAAPDGFMEKAAESGKGIRILRQNRWETLVSFIISQRKSIPAIRKSIEALCKLCGDPIHAGQEELYAFPSPCALLQASDSDLSDCGLGYRLPYIKDAAAALARNSALLDEWAVFDDMALLSSLKTIRGVGDKIANCVMLFAYGRTASVPIDTWINKIITEKYNGQNPFLKYGADAGIMQQYAFYYILQNKTEVKG